LNRGGEDTIGITGVSADADIRFELFSTILVIPLALSILGMMTEPVKLSLALTLLTVATLEL